MLFLRNRGNIPKHFVRNPEQNRALERPRRRCKVDIKIEVRKRKVELSLYQTVAGSRICETSRFPQFQTIGLQMAMRLSGLRVGRALTPGRILVLIYVRGRVDTRAIVRLEGWSQSKKVVNSSGIDPTNCLLKMHPDIIQCRLVENICVAGDIVPVMRSCEHGNEPSGEDFCSSSGTLPS
jgi:hypothetical protein